MNWVIITCNSDSGLSLPNAFNWTVTNKLQWDLKQSTIFWYKKRHQKQPFNLYLPLCIYTIGPQSFIKREPVQHCARWCLSVLIVVRWIKIKQSEERNVNINWKYISFLEFNTTRTFQYQPEIKCCPPCRMHLLRKVMPINIYAYVVFVCTSYTWHSYTRHS